MKKADDLKKLLLKSVASLAQSPENLTLFVDRGSIACRAGSLSFEYRYTLNIVVQDFAGSIDTLIVPILGWIAENQPELLQKSDSQPFSFESEILDGDLSDVSIDIALSERVRITPGEDAHGKPGVHATHLDDTLPHDAFPGVCRVNLITGIVDAA
ncbi:phage tail protein [Sphingomonadaceae bacterium OTU29MARTA1]|nr:phage tail protein [Sphingomonadaceae bacterium OTU29MARTA1]